MKLPTLYIAGPMSGLPDSNYSAFRDAAILLDKAGYRVLNPTTNDLKKPRPDVDWSWYMRRSLEQIAVADHMAVLPRWQNSKGASLEVDLALQLGMKVATVDSWLRDAKEATE